MHHSETAPSYLCHKHTTIKQHPIVCVTSKPHWNNIQLFNFATNMPQWNNTQLSLPQTYHIKTMPNDVCHNHATLKQYPIMFARNLTLWNNTQLYATLNQQIVCIKHTTSNYTKLCLPQTCHTETTLIMFATNKPHWNNTQLFLPQACHTKATNCLPQPYWIRLNYVWHKHTTLKLQIVCHKHTTPNYVCHNHATLKLRQLCLPETLHFEKKHPIMFATSFPHLSNKLFTTSIPHWITYNDVCHKHTTLNQHLIIITTSISY